MVNIGTGLRMMQAGGVDRTGLADIADALGTPGLDLLDEKRAAAQDELLMQSLLDLMSPIEEEKPKEEMKPAVLDGVSDIGELRGYFSEMGDQKYDSELEKFLDNIEIPNVMFRNGGYVDYKGDKTDDGQSLSNFLGLEGLIAGSDFLNKLYELYSSSGLPLFENGGRVDLFQGGPSQQGQTQRGGLEGGRRGFGGPPGGGGGNQKSQKEVDIDQLKKEEEEKAKMVTTKTTLNPALYGLVEDQLSLQTPPEPMQEQSFLDTVSKYNPLQQDFQVTPNLSFGYDINPNLKDLSDIDATAGFSYSFNQGGPVSVGMDDNKKTLRISEDDKFIEAEQMLRGDTELYNYLVGGEIMPGLSFELGVMDDAVMEPGMRSPDDLKFFNIKKTF